MSMDVGALVNPYFTDKGTEAHSGRQRSDVSLNPNSMPEEGKHLLPLACQPWTDSKFTWSQIQQHPQGAYRPSLLEPDYYRGTAHLHIPHSANDRSSPGTARHGAQWTTWPKRN